MTGTDVRQGETRRQVMFALQVSSFLLIWLFVIGIAAWIINLVVLSVKLQDAIGATAAISIVAIPVFITLAGVLTYVFVGLQREERRVRSERERNILSSIVALVAAGLIASPSVAQTSELPSDILGGRIVFEEKGCTACHAIGGYGGTTGPDLSSDRYYGSFMQLASDVWNHLPEMNRKRRQLRQPPSRLTADEALSLFAFLYSLRYLGEPGSVVRGRRLMTTKGCISCHAVGGRGGDTAPDLASLETFASPVFMAQTMWNHIPEMMSEIGASERVFPMLRGQDIVDISSFIRTGFHEGAVIRMSPGDPNRGRDVFTAKQCHQCHDANTVAHEAGPDLSTSASRKGVAEIAALMWNHGPKMAEYMADEAIGWPSFEGTEMADLIAYIYFLGFEDSPGDAALGRAVLTDKGCLVCHKPDGEGVAMDFGSIRRLDRPVRMVELMWNHASEMEDKLVVRNVAWPKLSKQEMQDLYAFLRKLSAEKDDSLD